MSSLLLSVNDTLKEKLLRREKDGSLRQLSNFQLPFDFVSNDYLGLARNVQLQYLIQNKFDRLDEKRNGSGGSRLLSGNFSVYRELEECLSNIFQSEACLVFNSGYQANLALISCVPQKGDTIIYDSLSHVCLKEGAWLSKANTISFMHNDIQDLEKKLKDSGGNKFIVIESVYSMDGDESPIDDIISLAKKNDASIIVDEAHTTGSYGSHGSGWLVHKGLHHNIFAKVYTFGKAMGVHGACVCGSRLLIDFLINFGRSFIYTTALPPHSVVSINEAFKFLNNNLELQSVLYERINFFRERMKEAGLRLPNSKSAIQPILLPGNESVKMLATALNNEGFDVRPILSPTVKKGSERLRISLHAHNSHEQIDDLVNQIKIHGPEEIFCDRNRD